MRFQVSGDNSNVAMTNHYLPGAEKIVTKA